MPLLELFEPCVVETLHDGLGIGAGASKSFCLVHDYVVRELKSRLHAPSNEIAQSSVEIGMFAFHFFLQPVYLIFFLEILFFVSQDFGNSANSS